MRVTVMTPSRTKMLLDEVETLRDVKLQIMTNTGIPARQQLVYFKGRQLKSLRRPLSAYGVRDGSTLYLVKRLGICRCLACRNSRYIEREEAEEERLQLLRLLGEPPDRDDLSPVEVSAEVMGGSEVELSSDGGSLPASWPVFDYGYQREVSPGAELVQERRMMTTENDGSNAERVGDEDATDMVETEGVEGEVMDDADEEEADVGHDVEEGVEEAEEEEEVTEDTDGGMEDAEEAEEPTHELEEVEEVEAEDDEEEEDEEAMDAVAGETEDLNEENEEADIAEEEDLELSGEEADDEDDHEEVAEAEEEEADALEPEDTEDETANDNPEEATEDNPEEDAHDEEDEDATILYSLVTGREEVPRRREEQHRNADGADGDDEEEDGEERRAEPVFVRQQAFEEDGANSVGEEDPDITELEDEEAETAGTLPAAEQTVPERVQDLLLAMTQPTPEPEDEEEQEEQYPEDDPLFDPPDEEDPLLAPQDSEDAGYASGDEMDRAG